MHRAALRALAACASLTALTSTLSAQPIPLDAQRYAQPPQQYAQPQYAPPQQQEPAVVEQPPPVVVAQAVGNMGGGFIEFLFRGSIQQQPGSYGQPPQQQYGPAPQYPQPPQYGPQAPQPPAPVNYEPDTEDQGYRNPLVRSPRQPLAVPPQGAMRVDPARYQINPKYVKQVVPYHGKEAAGTIIIDTPNKFLFLVQGDGTALRYGVGVGRPGFTWAGVKTVSQKREWPDWTPPPEMLDRQPDLPRHMAGGPNNPLGARAMYLGSSLYRIHGSNEPWTIGTNVSSGCIRMRNEDVIDLYERVKVGTKVVVI
jgi:lipoprotein-anchoring transpeptidase ErfK/SrfK